MEGSLGRSIRDGRDHMETGIDLNTYDQPRGVKVKHQLPSPTFSSLS